jgi:hypothetical protein
MYKMVARKSSGLLDYVPGDSNLDECRMGKKSNGISWRWRTSIGGFDDTIPTARCGAVMRSPTRIVGKGEGTTHGCSGLHWRPWRHDIVVIAGGGNSSHDDGERERPKQARSRGGEAMQHDDPSRWYKPAIMKPQIQGKFT